MNLTPVSSSNIAAIGYENGTLYVQFRSGSLYAYYAVPENVYHAFMSAPSYGRFHADKIKDVYRYQRIG